MMGKLRKGCPKRLLVVGITTIVSVSLLALVIVISIKEKSQESDLCQGNCAAATHLIDCGNFNADPCHDFYEFACGKWSLNRPIPEFQGGVTVSSEMRKRIEENLLRLLGRRMYIENERVSVVSDVLTFFDACMDTVTINRTSIPTIKKLLDDIGTSPLIHSNWDPKKYIWYEAVARALKRTSDNCLIRWRVVTDYNNASRNIVSLGAGPRTFQDPIDPFQMANYKLYALQLISRLVNEDLGIKDRLMSNDTSNLVELDIQLNKFVTPESDKKPRAERVTIKEMGKRLPGVDWLKFMQIIMNDTLHDINQSLTEDEEVLLDDEGYIKKLIEFLKDENNLRTAANYLSFNVIAQRIMVLPEQYREYFVNYTKNHYNVETPRDRNLICLKEVTDRFPQEVIGHLYLTNFVDQKDIIKVKEIANAVQNKLETLIRDSTWMDDVTKNKALLKLRKVRIDIGSVAWLANLTKISEIYSPATKLGKMGHNALENTLRLRSFQMYRAVKLVREQDSPLLTAAASVDAVYQRSINALEVSAGMIMQPYYFGPKANQFMHYGSLGYITGHELGHAFDTEGMRYNENGNWEEWWSKSSKTEYDKRVNCLVEQYNNYDVNITNIFKLIVT